MTRQTRFQTLFGRIPRRSSGDRSTSRRLSTARTRRLNVEPLEERAMLSTVPVLHSNPGAAVSLFLDFDGHFEPVWGSFTNVTTPPYDIDGDALTFSSRELSNIQAIWQGVAEDYSPFNIDVTTVEPSVLAEGTPIGNANGVALRVAIGGFGSDWYAPGTTGYGGISYIGLFTNSTANVAYVFAGNQDHPIATGEIVSHEAGHAFGLEHQVTPVTASWQSIMYPAGSYRDFSTWDNGPISTGGPLQDDMAILAGTTNGFGYRSDDHGGTIASATPLSNTGATWNGAGRVGPNGDVDMFSFTIAAEDTYRMVANVDSVSRNLDAVLELRNSAGQLLSSANRLETLSSQIIRTLTPGNYYLAVKSSGTYGWIGQYSVTIDAPPAGIAGVTVTPASRTMSTGEDGRQTSLTVVLQTWPTGDVIIPISSSNLAEGTLSAANLVFNESNWDIPQTVTVTGVSDGIIDNDTAYSVILGGASSVDAAFNGLDPADVSVINVDNDAAGFVYRTNYAGGTIERSRLSGSQPETLVNLKALSGGIGSFTPRGIAVDLAGSKMYWTDVSQKTIQRANLDGSNVETLVSFPTATLRGIALDVATGKMYWSDSASLKIQRANLNGTGIEDVVTNSLVTDISLDTAAGKMYWTEQASDVLALQVIRRANLNGTNIEVLWTGLHTSAAGPFGIALDVGAGKMYWADSAENLIRRSNLDGTGVEVVVNTATYADAVQVRNIALDIPAGKIYWTDYTTKTVYRANLDGSMIASIESGAALLGLAVVHPGPEISVTHRTGLVTGENGGSDVFRVTLTTQPTANVTVALSSSDTTEGTLSTNSLTFTPANWNVTQTVTVIGVNDSVVDGNISYTIVAAAVSSDPNYQGLNPADVSVVNLDDDITKFYVVNDATQDKTYEYNVSGSLVESYNLNSGNTASRGAASTAAGDKVWVVDANRKVYVYNASGGLLGSWSAGTMASNATPEGIATNGTDVWIVDSKSDKVFKYSGAATRLSGSQNAASSFSLNSSNTSPKDIVTDGTSLWVVNDSSTDKVFKYTVAGALLGSWTIDAANTAPTGITIDPANVSTIWIVDSGTDKVYQYTAAATRTSGSQSAAANFPLAAGNTNPQGIADPPSASLALLSSPGVVGSDDHSLAADAAAWSIGIGQATTASLGVSTTNRPSDSQRVVATRRDVDEIMSRLRSPLEPVRSPTSDPQTMAIVSRRPGTQRDDVDLDASIDLIADDLLKMEPIGRGQ